MSAISLYPLAQWILYNWVGYQRCELIICDVSVYRYDLVHCKIYKVAMNFVQK